MPTFDRKKWLAAETYENELDNLAETIALNENTDEMWRESWIENSAANWPYAKNGKWVTKLYRQYKGNCFVAGPGPSLEKNIRELWAAWKLGAYIISLDRCYDTLIKAGIIPQLVVTVDAQECVKEFFQKIDGRTKVAMCLAQHPEIYKTLKERNAPLYWFSIINPFSKFWTALYKKYGERIACVRAGGSVMFCACDIAVHMGFETITTVGNDCCWYSAEEAAKDGHDNTLPPHDDIYTIGAYLMTANSLAMLPFFHGDEVQFRDLSGGLEKPGWTQCKAQIRFGEKPKEQSEAVKNAIKSIYESIEKDIKEQEAVSA